MNRTASAITFRKAAFVGGCILIAGVLLLLFINIATTGTQTVVSTISTRAIKQVEVGNASDGLIINQDGTVIIHDGTTTTEAVISTEDVESIYSGIVEDSRNPYAGVSQQLQVQITDTQGGVQIISISPATAALIREITRVFRVVRLV